MYKVTICNKMKTKNTKFTRGKHMIVSIANFFAKNSRFPKKIGCLLIAITTSFSFNASAKGFFKVGPSGLHRVKLLSHSSFKMLNDRAQTLYVKKIQSIVVNLENGVRAFRRSQSSHSLSFGRLTFSPS